MVHFFRPETLRWLKIRSNQYLEFSFCSNFEPSQSFRSEKVSHLGVLTRDQDFEPIWNWAISKSNSYDFTWQHLLRWLFEPSQEPPRIQLRVELPPFLDRSELQVKTYFQKKSSWNSRNVIFCLVFGNISSFGWISNVTLSHLNLIAFKVPQIRPRNNLRWLGVLFEIQSKNEYVKTYAKNWHNWFSNGTCTLEDLIPRSSGQFVAWVFTDWFFWLNFKRNPQSPYFISSLIWWKSDSGFRLKFSQKKNFVKTHAIDFSWISRTLSFEDLLKPEISNR